MNKDEAWRIIEECRGWNTSQRSIDYAFARKRTPEDDIHDARRLSLAEAWKTVGEQP
jgi:hypothetical protein